ncbi:MAG TPA: hypothetical protein VGJ54_10290, partial [Streptosporangiaceae bacterium]
MPGTGQAQHDDRRQRRQPDQRHHQALLHGQEPAEHGGERAGHARQGVQGASGQAGQDRPVQAG